MRAVDSITELPGMLMSNGAPSINRSIGYVDPSALNSIAEFAKTIKTRAMALLNPCPGQRVLDIGCGPGIDTSSLAACVTPNGCVVGIDRDPCMISSACSLARSLGFGSILCHTIADAFYLPFGSGVFDGTRCERLLQHVNNPMPVISEMLRVTKCGGTVVVIDTDWGSLSIDCEDSALERRIVGAVAEFFANGYAGRQIGRLMKSSGLELTNIEVLPLNWNRLDSFRRTSFEAAGVDRHLISAGRVDLADWCRFVDLLERANAIGAFFASANVVLVAGRKVARDDNRHASSGRGPETFQYAART